jgi:uncharacterized membrane protein
MAAPEQFPATRVSARPFYRPLRGFAASCLIGALATDLAYSFTADFIWVDFSDWLVSIGAAVGVVAFLVGAIELLSRRGWARPRLPALVFDLVAWAVAVLDVMVHTRDSWTSVVPWGLALSAIAVLILLVSEWTSRTLRASPAPVVSERAA